DRDPTVEHDLRDDPLELGEALERHADREIDALLVELVEDLDVEKRCVDARFELRRRDDVANRTEAIGHEIACAVRIVHVSGAMEEVEELTRLRDRAKKRVIAARTTPLAIVPDRGTLCAPTRREHRTVEVQRHPRKLLLRDSL